MTKDRLWQYAFNLFLFYFRLPFFFFSFSVHGATYVALIMAIEMPFLFGAIFGMKAFSFHIRTVLVKIHFENVFPNKKKNIFILFCLMQFIYFCFVCTWIDNKKFQINSEWGDERKRRKRKGISSAAFFSFIFGSWEEK